MRDSAHFMTNHHVHTWNSVGEVQTLLPTSRTLTIAEDRKGAASLCYEIDPLADPRWSELVERCPQSSVFHSTPWLRALRNVYGYEPVVVTTSAPGAPLTNGIVFCRIKSWLTGPRLVSLPFSDHCEPLVGNPQELDDLLAHMRRYVRAGKWKYAEIRPISFEPSFGSGYGTHVTYRFHRLDLTPSIEQIFGRFHKDCVQRKIRRAEKEKLKYEAGNSEALLHKFYGLMVGMRRRKSLPPQPLKWFRGLLAEFGEDLQIRVASHGDRPIASIITLSRKKTMIYKYGCSDPAFNKLGGMALLFWRAIQDAKSARYDQLDMGRSDSDNLGLIKFKDHWGAASAPLAYWKYPQKSASGSRPWKRPAIQRAISFAPEALLRTVGKLLYKHIG
jgi:hypothetical protein